MLVIIAYTILISLIIPNVNGHSYGATVCVLGEQDMITDMCANAPTQVAFQITTSPAPGGSIVPGVRNIFTVSAQDAFIGHLFVFYTPTSIIEGFMENVTSDSKLVRICSLNNIDNAITHTAATPMNSITFAFTPPPNIAGPVTLSATTINSRIPGIPEVQPSTCNWGITQIPLVVAGATTTVGSTTDATTSDTTPTPSDMSTPTPVDTPTPMDTPTPIINTPTPSPTPSSVGPAGYDNSLSLLPNLNLYWKSVNQGDATISFALSCACSGWFAVAWSPNGQMADSDAVLVSLTGTTATAESVKLPAQAPPTIGSNPNVVLTEISGETVDGITTVKFTRQISVGAFPLNTDQIVIGANQGQNLADFTQYHGASSHTNPNSNKVQNFLTGKASTTAGTFGVRDVHALIMFLSWGIFLPFGVLFARYARGLSNIIWFKVHRVVQYGAYGMSVIGFLIGVSMTKVHFNGSYHGGLGLIITLLGLFQVLWAFFRPHVNSGQKPETIRVVWEWVHWTNGRICVLLAILQIAAGIKIIGYTPAVFGCYIALAVLALIGITIKEVYNCMKPDPNITPCTGRKYHTEKI